MSALPGLNDQDALGEAYQTVRASGLIALGLQALCFIALKLGMSQDTFGVPLLLTLCWGMAMLGLSFLIDGRRGWLMGVRDGILLQMIIGFHILGALLTLAGIGGSLLVSYAVIVS